MATVDAHGMFYQHPRMPQWTDCWCIAPYGLYPLRIKGILYKHIGVGFALLVRHHRAMRRPQAVERVTGTNLHAFSYSHVNMIIHAGIRRLAGNKRL